MNYKALLDELIATPLLTSLFIVDFAILTFHRPPAFFSILMLGGLVALAMYFGQKFAIFDIKKGNPIASGEVPSDSAELR